jgi:ribosomal protein S18 acetylase RimI-like enzyme
MSSDFMAEAERVAHERGYARMNLSVSTRNQQAIAFNERLGWQKVLEGGGWKGQMIKCLGGTND